MTEIICTFISAGAGIIVAILSLYIKRSDDRAEQRQQQTQENMLLLLKMVDATLELSSVNAIAITGGHTNGNVEAAQEKAATAGENYKDFLQRLAVQS